MLFRSARAAWPDTAVVLYTAIAAQARRSALVMEHFDAVVDRRDPVDVLADELVCAVIRARGSSLAQRPLDLDAGLVDRTRRRGWLG